MFLEEQKCVVVPVLKYDSKGVSETEKRGGDRYGKKTSGNKNLMERGGMTEEWHVKEFIPGLWHVRGMSKLLRGDFQKKMI